MKILSFLTALLFLTVTASAQRITYDDLLGFYTDASDSQIIKIDTKLKKLSSNWSEPKSGQNGSQLALIWKYQYESNTMGYLRIYKDTNHNIPIKLNFSFPYYAQFQEYKASLDRTGSVVNRITENGANSVVYQTELLTIILTTYPAILKKFFEDGKPVDYYQITMHLKP